MVPSSMPNFTPSVQRVAPCQKPQFGANFDIFGSSCTDRLLSMRAKFGVLEQTHGIRSSAKFSLDRFILWSSCGEKPPIPYDEIVSNSGSSYRQHCAQRKPAGI